ncbi:carbon-nitrogen hydrolase family protein [Thalassotalea maritima]|uniref:carbon-nitrogen hydrolase family protein n=1 Tax=Thalassotalea maritima TaxID=3242416 RepID=UPI00352994CB
MLTVTALQMTSVADIDKNLQFIDQQLSSLTPSSEHLVVLPECCLFFGGSDKQQLAIAEPLGHGYMQQQLSQLAIKHNVYLLAGSVPICHSAEKFTASSLLFSPMGTLIADYQKLHLFDVNVSDNQGQYRESNYTQSGDKLMTVALPSANVGLSICYDLRFAGLFAALRDQGAELICVPSAFTYVTGKAHWQALLRARAIENQVYIVAAGQVGTHENGRQTFGHSMIIDPWGEIIASIDQGHGMITANIDREKIFEVRNQIPVATHNRFITTLGQTPPKSS